MFRLTNRLALSNLIKNRKLYYPYTLATILVIAITYILHLYCLIRIWVTYLGQILSRRFWVWDL